MSLTANDTSLMTEEEAEAFWNRRTILMSSKEISDLCEKRHDNVMADIRHMFSELNIDPLEFQGIYKDSYGRSQTCYYLRKDMTLTIIAGYSIKIRKRIIDRWMELEAKENKRLSNPFDPGNPQHLRKVLLSYTEKVEKLEQRVEQLLPSENALNRIANADGSLCVTDAAKALQIRPKDLFEYLRGNGWIYRRAGSSHDVGYQSRVIDGTLEHKVTTVLRPDGSERVTEQVRITPKGLTKLAKLIPGTVREA